MTEQVKSIDSKAFSEHVKELRRRLFYVVLTIVAGTVAAYMIEKHLVAALLKPAEGQQFIFTSPGGGLDFLFRVCLYAGVAISIPVIIFNLLKFLEPAFPEKSRKYVFLGAFASGIMAVVGLCFGYFLGLPAAMHFLLNQTVSVQVQALLTVQAYMSFVIKYLLGSVLIFQLPLVMIFINRIKPLKPSKLLSLKYERWVILLSFVAGFLLNPSPRLQDQMLLVIPLLLMYQISILIIAIINKSQANKSMRDSVEGQVVGTESALITPEEKPAQLLNGARKPGFRTIGNRQVISDFM